MSLRNYYELARGGRVRFSTDEITAVQPHYGDTIVTLTNGTRWLLKGIVKFDGFNT